MADKEKELLTVQQAADFLGVSRIKISRLLKNGTLLAKPNPLDSRQKLIPREQLDSLKPYTLSKPNSKTKKVYDSDPQEPAEPNEATSEKAAEAAEANQRVEDFLASYQPKTPLGRKLLEVRAAMIAAGEPMLTLEEVEREIAERRGGVGYR